MSKTDPTTSSSVPDRASALPISADGVPVGDWSDPLKLLGELNLAMLPRHVAFIMDGNRRWAKERRLNKLEGHRAG